MRRIVDCLQVLLASRPAAIAIVCDMCEGLCREVENDDQANEAEP
jgi:hypothetical protein